MKRVLLAVVLGLVAPLAFVVGGSLFEVQGQNSSKEIVAGCVAIALYCAACQFWLSRKGSGGFRANWPMMVGMVGALLVACLLFIQGGLFHNWPQFISGCVGSFAGALLSVCRTGKVKCA